MQWFLVVNNIEYCLIWARDREEAKRKANIYIEGDKDRFEVTPITPTEYHLKAVVFGGVIINNMYGAFDI